MASPQLPDYRSMADAAAGRHGIPTQLFENQIGAESNWDPTAGSPVGARGLGQLMPATAAGLGVKNVLNPQQNLEGAAKYLQEQYNKFGRWDLALAAYNAGPGAVQAAGNKVPNYAETQAYVKKIMAGGAANATSASQAGGGGSGVPATQGGAPSLASLFGSLPSLSPQRQLMDFAAPSKTTTDLLGRIGGTAASVATRAQNEIPLPTDESTTTPTSGASTASDGKSDPYNLPMIPLKGGLINGSQRMVTGNAPVLRQRYPNLITQDHVDWSHVNNRLLSVVSKVAEKELGPQAVVTMTSGYRDNGYSQANGGFSGDPHTKGIAGDFYVDGHPIGDVIPPEVWAKHGVRSGNTPGFYKGKPDAEHLDLVGIPIKGGKS